MMKLRLLVVAHQFWPRTDDSSMRLLYWTSALQRQGAQVTVLTPRWHNSWPAKSMCREVGIVRLSPAPKSSWNETYYLRHVGQWINHHQSEFDVIYVDRPDSLTHQIAMRSVRGSLPLGGRFSLTHSYPIDSRMRDRDLIVKADACRRLDSIFTPNLDSKRWLVANGIEPDIIIPIVDISWLRLDRQNAGIRSAAANALFDINPDMFLPEHSKLIVTIGTVNDTSGHDLLVRAVGPLCEQFPRLRVWSIGGGPGLNSVCSTVKDCCWHHEILFHGCFDDWEEILQVTDLIVFPGTGHGYEFLVPTAIGNGIPLIAPDNVDLCDHFGDELTNHLFSTGNEKDLRSKIAAWLASPDAYEQSAFEKQQKSQPTDTPEKTVQKWLDSFEKLGCRL